MMPIKLTCQSNMHHEPKYMQSLIKHAIKISNFIRLWLSDLGQVGQIGLAWFGLNWLNSIKLTIGMLVELICLNYIMGSVNFIPVDLI